MTLIPEIKSNQYFNISKQVDPSYSCNSKKLKIIKEIKPYSINKTELSEQIESKITGKKLTNLNKTLEPLPQAPIDTSQLSLAQIGERLATIRAFLESIVSAPSVIEKTTEEIGDKTKQKEQVTLKEATCQQAAQKLAESQKAMQEAEEILKYNRELVEGFTAFNQEPPQFLLNDFSNAMTNCREVNKSLAKARQADKKAQAEFNQARGNYEASFQ